MLNIGGLKSFQTPEAGRRQSVGKAAGKKQDEKKTGEKRTDTAAFDGAAAKKTYGGYSGFKVSSKNDKTDGLSAKAQDYLEKLKKKYGNMDFIVSDFSSDEEADKLLAGGKGEYNVLISPDLLEKMAADESVAAEYEGLIEESVGSIDEMKQGLGEDADMVEKFGVSVDADGKLTLRAKLIEGLTDSKGSSTVKAGSVEEMLSELNNAKEAQAEKLAELRKARSEKTADDDTDDADSELEKLNNDKKQILSQLKGLEDETKKAELMDKLREIESKLAHRG